VNEEFLFGCATGLLDGGYGNRDGISEGHAYVIMEARQLSTGQRLVKLRYDTSPFIEVFANYIGILGARAKRVTGKARGPMEAKNSRPKHKLN
jgi:hypothetical protein